MTLASFCLSVLCHDDRETDRQKDASDFMKIFIHHEWHQYVTNDGTTNSKMTVRRVKLN